MQLRKLTLIKLLCPAEENIKERHSESISCYERLAGPILEFKGTIRYVQKGHLTLITQVDPILQD